MKSSRPGKTGTSLSAFTLIELLIASAVFLVIILTIYSAFQAGISGYRNIDEAIDGAQSARIILERISCDLRNSFRYSEQDSRFAGDKNEISFLTLVDTFRENKLEPEYALVSYKLEGDRLMRLCRKNEDSLKEGIEVPAEEMASVEELVFSYGYLDSDGYQQFDKYSWSGSGSPGEKGQFPLAVKVSLTLKNKAKDNYERTIFLVGRKASGNE